MGELEFIFVGLGVVFQKGTPKGPKGMHPCDPEVALRKGGQDARCDGRGRRRPWLSEHRGEEGHLLVERESRLCDAAIGKGFSSFSSKSHSVKMMDTLSVGF